MKKLLIPMLFFTAQLFGQTTIDLRDPPYNCKFDGRTDDTLCWQTALAAASDTGRGATTMSFVCPVGDSIIKAGLAYTGDTGKNIVIRGASGGTFFSDNNACQIVYRGPPTTGAVLRMFRANGSVIQNININANRLAKYGIWYDSDGDTGGTGSSNNKLDHVTIWGWTGTGSAAVAVGHVNPPVTPQVDNFYCVDCQLMGIDDGTSDNGFLALTTGNVKNFFFLRGSINGVNTAIKGVGSGVLNVVGTNFSDFRAAVVNAPGAINVFESVAIENDHYQARFADTVGFSGALTVRNSYWAGPLPNDDFLFAVVGGSLTLENNQFQNTRAASSVPRIQIGMCWGVPFQGHGFPQFRSVGNYYENADDTTASPFINGCQGNVPYFDPAQRGYPGYDQTLQLVSYNDMGGWAATNNVKRLRPHVLDGGDYIVDSITSATQTGTYAARSLTGFMRLAPGDAIRARNNARTADLLIAQVNASDQVELGDSAGVTVVNGATQFGFFSKSGDPTSSDIPNGQCAVYKNTLSGDVKLWCNSGGTMRSVTLY